MPGTDLTVRLTTWVQDAIDTGALGEEFPYSVIPTVMQLGGGHLPAWAVIVMMRNPLLGQPPLTVKADIPGGIVLAGDQAKITGAIHQALGTLRDQHAAVLRALKNGGPTMVAVPPPPGQTGGN